MSHSPAASKAAPKTRAQKAARIRHLLATEGASVAKNTQGFNQGRYRSVARLDDYEALKRRARAIKEDAIARLPELIAQLTASVEANGGTVYLAADAADANRYICDLAQGARRLVKSKSMTTEEIEVNAALQAAGVEVVETDLGEWVLQLAEERPSHIVAPAIHKSRPEIAQLFNELFSPEQPLETAEELTAFARARLGDLIATADVGMTGANFIVAETGTLVLVTSEGNARKSAFVPPLYVAVAGVEKIVPTVEDVQPFVELIGRSGTGQDITSYISLFTPPFRTPVADFGRPEAPLVPEVSPATNGQAAARAFHLVLIDNGRLAMREDAQLKETLYCIRCSACANTCANFQRVGGHAFGGKTYSGGIATGWEAGVHGLDAAASFNDLCTGCTRCVPACPVGIDIPWINVVVRDRINRQGSGAFDWLMPGLRSGAAGGADVSKQVFGRFATLAKLGSLTAPLSNWVAQTQPVRRVMERVLGIDRRRALPVFQRETLARWFARRPAPPRRLEREVVLFNDIYTNHVHTARGKAAVRVLEALGAGVHLSAPMDSGRAPLSQGLIGQAEKAAQAAYAHLEAHLAAGRDVVVIEPTDLAMLWRDYAKLIPEASYERLRAHTHEAMAYVEKLVEEDGADLSGLRQGAGQPIAYHSHCQQRTLGLQAPTVRLLERLGYDVECSEVECCGMAGSFGYKIEYYELSMDVGQPLREQFTSEEMGKRAVTASGTSCHEQLEALLGRAVRHPLELMLPAEAD